MVRIIELLESGPWEINKQEISISELQGTELGNLKKNGYIFDEDPLSFDNIKSVIRHREIDILEQTLGHSLDVINASALFRNEILPTAKLNTPTNTLPKTFIVNLGSGKLYIANTYGAAYSLRFWLKII